VYGVWLRQDVFLVVVWLLVYFHSTSSLVKHMPHHGFPFPPCLSLQLMGGVSLTHIRGLLLFSPYFAQENKIFVSVGYVWSTCHPSMSKLEYYLKKSSQTKLWFAIVVQAMGINLNEHGAWACWNLPLFELLSREDGTTNLENQW
jgi:hypothetical protein